MALISNADVTAFTRSLIGEATEKHWTDAEIALYIEMAMVQVNTKYWYLLAPTETQVEATSLVVSTAYVSLPGREVGATTFTGSGKNDATFGGTYTHTADLTYVVKIDSESTPDTFTWSKDGGTSWYASGVSCSTSATTLDNGVTVTFGATTGHTDTEYWSSNCIISDCAKILRVEVAETRDLLRKIEPDELWKYSVYDDGAAATSYLNIWYLKYYSTTTDFPVALRPLIAVEAAIMAKTKDSGAIDAGILNLHRNFEDAARAFLATDSMYEPTIFGDYEQEDAYTRSNPCAWAFKENKIYLYKSYKEDD